LFFFKSSVTSFESSVSSFSEAATFLPFDEEAGVFLLPLALALEEGVEEEASLVFLLEGAEEEVSGEGRSRGKRVRLGRQGKGARLNSRRCP
jgi:hypothetical protein